MSTPATSESFSKKGYALLERAISSSDAQRYSAYALMNRQHPNYYAQQPGQASASRYGDVLGESLLVNLMPAIEAATGLALLPCYSALTICQHGALDAPPSGHAAHEITALLVLDVQGVNSWPFWLKVAGEKKPFSLRVGELLVYRGNELEGWREKFDGEIWAQVALHYVDANGEHAHYRFDGRRSLGAPLDRAQQDKVIAQRKEFDSALAEGDDCLCFCGSGQVYSSCHGLRQPSLSA
ncbi:MAG: hypothetical protein HKN59_05190 [Gammaproteobacteria bacterium]|nr:hypothetical protein [Gammaproteobacteria bacterium]